MSKIAKNIKMDIFKKNKISPFLTYYIAYIGELATGFGGVERPT